MCFESRASIHNTAMEDSLRLKKSGLVGNLGRAEACCNFLLSGNPQVAVTCVGPATTIDITSQRSAIDTQDWPWES
jgi:hypothetical protein